MSGGQVKNSVQVYLKIWLYLPRGQDYFYPSPAWGFKWLKFDIKKQIENLKIEVFIQEQCLE